MKHNVRVAKLQPKALLVIIMRFFPALLLVIGLVANPCSARDGLFMEITGRYNQVTFVEWDRGYAINEETGAIPTQSIMLGYQKTNQFYFEYTHTTGNDSVGYTGYTQTGQLIETDTAYAIDSEQYIFGKTFVTTVVYLGYEINSRNRAIGASANSRPLTEHIKQKQGFVGFKQNVIRGERYLVDFRFTAKMAFSSFMEVDFDQQFDNAGIHLGMDYTLNSQLFIGRRLPHNWLVGLYLNYEFTEIEQSEAVALSRNGEPFGAVFYHPYTELETVAVGLSLGKNF